MVQKSARDLSQEELHLIVKCRKGGLTWAQVHRLFPAYKRYHHLRWAMIKEWPQGLPPCGELTYHESLVHLYNSGKLPTHHMYKILGEPKLFEQYADHVKSCKQWYGLDFNPAISLLAEQHLRSSQNGTFPG